MDLNSLASVRSFAARWGDRPLDALINNAGVMGLDQGTTEDGFESHLGVNHLAHFLLADLLLPALRKGKLKRVIAVSSSAHRWAPWDGVDPHFRETEYNPHIAYARSKAANALFALGFDDRYAGEGIRAFSLMPGVIATPLMRHMSEEDTAALGERMAKAIRTPEQGAATVIWALVGKELEGKGGLYLQDCAEATPVDPDVMGIGAADHIKDSERATNLWSWSRTEVGLA